MTFQFEIVQCDCCGKLLTEKDGCTPKVFVNCSENKLRQTLRKNGWSVDLGFTKCPKCQKE
jgi:hypothetical protein